MIKLLLKALSLTTLLLIGVVNGATKTPDFSMAEKLQQPAPAIKLLNKKLVLKNNIKGEFNQEKHIKVLSRPLKSSGKFNLSEHQGLIWDTQQPTKNRIKVNSTGLYEWKSSGSDFNQGQWQVKPESQSAGFSRYAKSFQALLNADIKQLQQEFDLYWQHTANNWQLGLKPKQTSQLTKLISWIKVTGSDRVNMIQIREQSGDFSQINLSSIAPLNSSTSADVNAK
ncbi:outer membrane lipoprotein carrier protein LolA [Endozoicomonas sp. SM1973]|uniref:Outer membrane lipoprotein carrier protein LolA n=1 Tax=Spartinivicinus marinus TaxID=2994442 RepID=A0A853HVS6_9GAMM|nr:outer membrane lipoprotein carrier protein LolA [Spartinivicinus marinus]MCX4025408.1 outer membrane lipoprotein carrier protein LolA [Spartinivicinus marinus]NYZ65363.1 outer membrane lipoprotein carrier protein LolA [Spartinivicinus marinus]